eukprot:TRINITY_DN29160_c0_g1_i1.p1 TRINITY_DN29160_c0_g1~~TRINITY_DN29160_c0_g1_i1.p1  ORF type:complete len:462 (+),score=47.91 TRINITY_DN29160_c0_g1_i1:58-1443(+)
MRWLWSLCAVQSLRCFSDRSWDFLVPIALSSAFPGNLLPAIAVDTSQTIGRLCLAPKVALWYAAQASTRSAYLRLLVLELVMTSLCGSLLMLVAKQLLQSQGNFALGLFLVVSCILAAIESGFRVVLASTVAKHWPAKLSQSETELTHANSRVALCDLTAAAVTPFIISSISNACDHAVTAACLILWQLTAAAGVVICSRGLGEKLTALGDGNAALAPSQDQMSLTRVLREWLELPREVRGAMLGMVMLFCTVLSEGATSWLNMQGVSVARIAGWRSSMQIIGFLSAAAVPSVIQVFGLLKSARIGQGLQMCCAVVALVAILTDGTMPLLVAIALTRIGIWLYDLSLRQMVQRASPGYLLAPLLATEVSAQQSAQLVMQLVRLAFPRPSQFVIPVVVSVVASFTACILLNVSAWTRSTKQGMDLVKLSRQGVELGESGDAPLIQVLETSGAESDAYGTRPT